MTRNMAKELAALEKMTMADLKRKYAELFGDETRARNRTWLVRRIAWRLQANQYGGLSERARQRAAELANESDLRLTPPKVKPDRRTTQPGPRRRFPRSSSTPIHGSRSQAQFWSANTKVASYRFGCWKAVSSSRARSTARSRPWRRRSQAPIAMVTCSFT